VSERAFAGRCHGVSLIEVMITLLVLAIGLLGLAGLQLATVSGQFEAYQRAQALLLVEDMAGRLRASAAEARAAPSPYTADGGTALYGESETDCSDSTMTVAARDLCEWNNALIGNSVRDPNDASVASIINARGCIDRLADSVDGEVVIRVTVTWQGLVETAPPDLDCAENAYGNENLRRAVATRVVLAELADPVVGP
jgi:type IV pilus assembly protein PilV